MRLMFCPIVLALSACATATNPSKPAGMSESVHPLGTLTISGDELKQTGRVELPDALRATSPIFH